MSEYQYYEWQTIDRLLTDAGQDAVNGALMRINPLGIFGAGCVRGPRRGSSPRVWLPRP